MMDWKCANDDGGSAEISAPPEDVRVAQGSKSFAEGDAQAILAKGGPMGAYLWAHLHGIHNDRHGETDYTITVTVKDASGWCYLIAPVVNTTVKGVLDKPKRHRHCYIQYALPPGQEADDLKMAIANNIGLVVDVNGDRDRNDIDWLTSSLKDVMNDVLRELLQRFAAGQASVTEVLQKINEGKQRPF